MSIKVTKRILKLRGYKINKTEDNEILFTKPNGKKGKVVFLEKPKANVDDLASIFRELVSDPIHVIIVYDSITNPALKSFNDDIRHYFKDSELIQKDKLVQNPLKHRLTPTAYRVLSKEEKKQLLQKYNTLAHKLPAMPPTDIMAILFGFKMGDIVEVTSHYNYTTKKVDLSMIPQITYRHIRIEK